MEESESRPSRRGGKDADRIVTGWPCFYPLRHFATRPSKTPRTLAIKKTKAYGIQPSCSEKRRWLPCTDVGVGTVACAPGARVAPSDVDVGEAIAIGSETAVEVAVATGSKDGSERVSAAVGVNVAMSGSGVSVSSGVAVFVGSGVAVAVGGSGVSVGSGVTVLVGGGVTVAVGSGVAVAVAVGATSGIHHSPMLTSVPSPHSISAHSPTASAQIASQTPLPSTKAVEGSSTTRPGQMLTLRQPAVP